MKQIILAFVLFVAFGSTLKAQETRTTTTTTTQRIRYYYYPSSNIYYNPSTGDYWYYDDGTTAWVDVKTLPSTITITKSPKYTVYYNGTDVWKDNSMHQKKYKIKSNGVVKAKPKKS
jgi:hypothetical protein